MEVKVDIDPRDLELDLKRKSLISISIVRKDTKINTRKRRDQTLRVKIVMPQIQRERKETK